MSPTFNPTFGLNKVNSENELRAGDIVAITYYDEDGKARVSRREQINEGCDYTHYFGHRQDVAFHFIEQVERTWPKAGQFGKATFVDGTQALGFFDTELDFCTPGHNGRAQYKGSQSVVKFEEIQGVASEKTSDLIPGVDPKPGVDYVWDKDGDKWRLNPEVPSAGFNFAYGWDNPTLSEKRYAPYTTIDPRA